MNPNQIVNQVFKKKRTVSNVYDKQKKAVLFAFFILSVLPLMGSCILGEMNLGMAAENGTLYFPETSKYTVVFETSYGELWMDLEAAIAWMLPAVVPPDYEEEAIKAQAILLRTELLSYYEKNDKTPEFCIFLDKTLYKKIYFTFLEQKEVYGENYSGNFSVYRHAVLETAGMYLKGSVEKEDAENAEKSNTGWFLVSAGSTREGILCEKDFQSENYYSEKIVPRREFQTAIKDLYEKDCILQGEKEENNEQIEEIYFKNIDETEEKSLGNQTGGQDSPYGRNLIFLILFEDGSREEYSMRPEIFCEKFHLVSPCVEDITETNTSVTITVKGVGHGSGMSLFGANELAKEGKDYTEILNYFFTNIAIDKFE